jgi:ornithine cyclodeaminase
MSPFEVDGPAVARPGFEEVRVWGRDRLVVDSRDQCARLGELQHALAAGLVSREQAIELGEIIAMTHPRRRDDGELTICDLTGVGVQDVAAATLVIERPRPAKR